METQNEETNGKRPPTSPCCGARSWWNGTRRVLIVVAAPAGSDAATTEEQSRARCKCTECCSGFTLYAAGEYPQRVYQPDVVAQVSAAHAVGGESARTAARRAGASATSARRWTRWIARLVDPGVLLALAARLDPQGIHGEGLSLAPGENTVRAMAARAIDAMEALGSALVRVGLSLASRTGLGRLLEWQYVAHRMWLPLVSRGGAASPSMVFGTVEEVEIRSAHARSRRSG